MNTAFQTLLSSVSDMGLNEGDFLRMNNLLKKAYDQDKKEEGSAAQTLTKPLDIQILLKDTLDKSVIELSITSITRSLDGRDPDRYLNSLPTLSINGHFETDAVIKQLTFKHVPELCKFLQGWIMRVRPMTITVATGRPFSVRTGGFETTYTFKSVLESCKVEDEEEDDDDGEWPNYNYSTVMGIRFVEQFKEYVLAVAY